MKKEKVFYLELTAYSTIRSPTTRSATATPRPDRRQVQSCFVAGKERTISDITEASKIFFREWRRALSSPACKAREFRLTWSKYGNVARHRPSRTATTVRGGDDGFGKIVFGSIEKGKVRGHHRRSQENPLSDIHRNSNEVKFVMKGRGRSFAMILK